MIDFKEFNDLDKREDLNNPFCGLFYYPDGECFYIEPVFYTQLMGFKDHHADKFPLILERMEQLVKKNKKIVFTGNFDNPLTKVEDNYIFLEITDVTDPSLIFAEDKSRGSDYGD